MKERIRHILREETSNRMQNKLIDMIKTIGFKITANAVGGIDNLKKITGLYNYVMFLKLFSDMDSIESEENPDVFIYRYEKGNNIMVVDKRDDDMRNIYVYVNYDLIYQPLSNFSESKEHYEKIRLLTRWLKTTYMELAKDNLQVLIFHPRSEDYGFLELLN